MPSKTFLNLHPAKRDRIIEAAYEEFALNDYHSASVTNLVRTLGIAKGSVYQYFKNKNDLYLFLIDHAEQKRLAAAGKLAKKPKESFFNWFRKLHLALLRFDLDNPLYSAFLNTVSREGNPSGTGNIALEKKKLWMKFFKKALEQYREKGLIRNDININLQSFYLAQLSMGFFDYLVVQYDIDYESNLQGHADPINFSSKKLKKVLQEFSQLAEEGLTRPTGSFF